MERKSILKETVTRVISDIAYKTASNSCNSACIWWQYQPKQPEALKKLKKRNKNYGTTI